MIAHGVDIIEVQRIADMLERHGQHFLDRVFTAGEQAYAAASRRRHEHLAARFAAKEAVLKAIGTGWRSGIAWTDVEVVPLPSGQPTVRLHGRAMEAAHEQGIANWSLSLSHTSSYAVASAIASMRGGTTVGQGV
jgi:holo-[acyl-carrier protein] synthase